MSNYKTLEFDIHVQPIYLNNNIKKHIIDSILTEKRCTEKNGYIMDIKEIISIQPLPISSTCVCPIFRVKCVCLSLLPEKGVKLVAKVTKIIPQGIFLSHGSIALLLPNTNFNGNFKNVNINDEMEVEITDTKYTKHEFQCICKNIVSE